MQHHHCLFNTRNSSLLATYGSQCCSKLSDEFGWRRSYIDGIGMKMLGSKILRVVGIAITLSTVFTSLTWAQQGSSVRLNKIIEQFENGEPSLVGEHWQLNDLEHNAFQLDEFESFLNEIELKGALRPELTPIVRIPYEANQDYGHYVKQMLDVGAMGIILPQVKTPADVTKLVRAMRYPPQRGAEYPEPPGLRGWGPSAAMRVWNVESEEYASKADVWPLNPSGELLAIAMVETREIIDNIDAILQVPGLGGLLIGPADLSMALGVGNPGPNSNAPEVIEAIERVGAACKRHNALCGIYMRSNVETRQEEGFMLFPSIAY